MFRPCCGSEGRECSPGQDSGTSTTLTHPRAASPPACRSSCSSLPSCRLRYSLGLRNEAYWEFHLQLFKASLYYKRLKLSINSSTSIIEQVKQWWYDPTFHFLLRTGLIFALSLWNHTFFFSAPFTRPLDFHFSREWQQKVRFVAHPGLLKTRDALTYTFQNFFF